jgi:integrase
MSRRANGESSIYQDASGVWHGWVTVAPGDRRHRKAKTRREVVAKVRELESARAAGAVTAPGQRWTVASWTLHVIDNVKGSSLALNTARSYRGHLLRWIEPHLGRLPLAELRTEHVETMFAAMLAEGLSAASCERVRATLRAALQHAVRRNLVARNVASLAQVPHRDEHRDVAVPLSAAEAQRVLTVASGQADAARWVLALLGMRPGEVLGLDWSQVDLEGGWLQVSQQLVESYPYRHGCRADDECRTGKALRCEQRIGGRLLTRPKSDAGRRRLSLPPELVALLREHRRTWLEARLKAGSAWKSQWGELVFAGPLGAPRDAGKDRRAWKELLGSAGVDERRLYDARHTAGTLLKEQGADVHQVKEQLGHSQIAVTSRYYVHQTDRLAQDSASRLGVALFAPEQART